MLRIALNALIADPGSGVGQHVRHLVEAMCGLDVAQKLYLLSPRPGDLALDLGTHESASVELVRAGGRVAGLGGNVGVFWWEQMTFPSTASRLPVDLLHCPYLSCPVWPRNPVVVTVHDVIPFRLAGYRRRPDRRAYLLLLAIAVRRATAIITVSEFSKAEIVRTLQVPETRIIVIPNGVASRYRPVAAQVVATAKEKFGLEAEYLLYFGGFEVRKNVVGTLEAYALLSEKLREAYPLVLAGSPKFVGHPLYPDPRPHIARLGLDSNVRVIGEVSDEDKVALYNGATLSLFPSKYEGFGLPVVEAMACGTPVVTSNVSALPEVAGDAALLVNPADHQELAQAVERLLESPDLRSDLRARGLLRAEEFSWRQAAESTAALYEAAAST